MLAVKHKTPLKSRTHSPSQNVLSPNNDDYERAQVRAARAASQRRKSFVGLEAEKSRQKIFGEEDLLGKDQILDLFQNCIKLATENKINQQNTWELCLIDHISEIVNADDGEDAETNFQKASCTLEAGVKIYAYRVDSVHSETFKVLGGLNRTAVDEGDGADNDSPQNVDGSEEDNGSKKKDSQKKVSTSSATLESYDALNVKKFDVAFTVDPLFNQMSAQFDEGGAKGLLLNTLSVYSGCKLVFDSSDIPTRYVKSTTGSNGSTTIDLSIMRDCFQKLKVDIKAETEISPTLRELLMMLNDPYRAAAEMERARQTAEINAEDCGDNQSTVSDEDESGEVLDDYVPDQYEEIHAKENAEPAVAMSQDSANWDFNFDGEEDREICDQDSLGGIHKASANENDARQLVNWITAGLDLRSNAWAGPDHWKFKKSQDLQKDPELSVKAGDKKKMKNEKFSIDFSCPPLVNMSDFAPAADPRSLMMPQSNASISTLLPDDCHYQPEDLVRLFLQPSVMCINHKGKRKSEITRPNSNAFETANMQWANFDSGVADDWDDENMHSDVEYSEDKEMIPQPRKVQKIEVDYDKTSKQIDVRVLKETLWEILQDISSLDQDSEELSISFKSLLSQVPTACGAADPGDISVHLCFICLLHLANEHNLCILDCASLDELYIQNVTSDSRASEVITG